MYSPSANDDELNALAASLATFRPTVNVAGRDRLMYLAGQAAAARAGRTTRAVAVAVLTLGSSLAAAVAGVLVGWQLHSPVAGQIVQAASQADDHVSAPRLVQDARMPDAEQRADEIPIPSERAAREVLAVGNPAFLALRRRALTYGVDALPQTAEPDRTNRPEQQSMLELRDRWLKRGLLSIDAT